VSALVAERIALAIEQQAHELNRQLAEAEAAGRAEEVRAIDARRARLAALAFEHAEDILRQEAMR
jgi:F0F1-type ATP synthase membrane subunit b/b'